MKLLKRMLTFTPLALFGFAFAQADPNDPTTWFQSAEAIVFMGGVIGTFAVNFLTSIGKNRWGTSGYQTVILSGVISAALALLAGALGLGVFTQGVLPAVGAVVVAFIGANIKYLANKQVAESGAKEALAKAKLLR